MEVSLVEKVFMAFIGFCLVASSVYIINDYRDKKEDLMHPVKKFRPIASGRVKPGVAIIVGLFVLILGLVIESLVNIPTLLWTLGYFVINLAYSFGLKRFALVDVFIIALCFVIRVFVGGTSTAITLQPWIVVMTFLLALFMALGKRRDDFNLEKVLKVRLRKSITVYNAQYLDYLMVFMAAVIQVSYLLYTLSPDIETKFKSGDLYYTAFFVLLGIMRYMQIVFVERGGGSPTDIFLKDKIIQASLIGWIITFGILIY